MRVFDLHCDCLSVCMCNKKSLYENEYQLDVKQSVKNDEHIQVFACFVPDTVSGAEAYDYFLAEREVLTSTIREHENEISWYRGEVKKNHCNAILSIEGGRAIKGDISLIPTIKSLGVSFFGVVWNGDNELASGVRGGKDGFTDVGKKAFFELERNNIIIDISHLNERGTDEALDMAQKPLAATHSNVFSACSEARNLNDGQITKLIKNGGLCGINLYPAFVNGTDDCEIDEFKPHIDKLLALGGDKIIALGTDFDGASMPHEIKNHQSLYRLYDNVVKWYGTKTADDMFFDNAKRFIDKNLKITV